MKDIWNPETMRNIWGTEDIKNAYNPEAIRNVSSQNKSTGRNKGGVNAM